MTSKNISDKKLIASIIEQESIFKLIRQTASWLDEEKLHLWLKSFSIDSHYEIKASSPEIETEMSWWYSDKAELEKIIDEIPDHVRDKAKRLHLVTPISTQINKTRASVLTHFSIFRTATDGRSSLYVTGKYEDDVIKENGRWFYKTRTVLLDTRIIEPFTHLPL